MATLCARAGVILVVGAVAVVVNPVARSIAVGGRAGHAGVDDPTIDTLLNPRGCAGAKATLCARAGEVLVVGAVAVVVDTVARSIVIGGRAGLAGVDKEAIDAQLDTRGGAGAKATPRGGAGVALVVGAVAVVVKAIAHLVAGQHLTFAVAIASVHATTGTSAAHPNLQCARAAAVAGDCQSLIGCAIAVVIVTVAGLVGAHVAVADDSIVVIGASPSSARPQMPAIVASLARHTEQRPASVTLVADSFVGFTVAVVVQPVAHLVCSTPDLGRAGHAAVLPAYHHPLGCALADPGNAVSAQ